MDPRHNNNPSLNTHLWTRTQRLMNALLHRIVTIRRGNRIVISSIGTMLLPLIAMAMSLGWQSNPLASPPVATITIILFSIPVSFSRTTILFVHFTDGWQK
jgi:hypothetical protein